jgi:mercuric ion transport protein
VNSSRQVQWMQYVSLFSSLGTLLCCALPSVLVLLGLGATVASVLSAIPFLVMLSRQKEWVFGFSGALITASFIYVYLLAPRLQGTTSTCSSEDDLSCTTAARFTRAILWISAGLFAFGFFVAFVLGPLLQWWDFHH